MIKKLFIYAIFTILPFSLGTRFAFASGITGVGTDILTATHDLDAMMAFDGYSGALIDGTLTNPVDYNEDDYSTYTNVIFVEAVYPTDYTPCSTSTAQDCIDNYNGVVVGDAGGYYASSDIWHLTVPSGGGTGTTSEQYLYTDSLVDDYVIPTVVSIFFTALLLGVGFGFIKKEMI